MCVCVCTENLACVCKCVCKCSLRESGVWWGWKGAGRRERVSAREREDSLQQGFRVERLGLMVSVKDFRLPLTFPPNHPIRTASNNLQT